MGSGCGQGRRLHSGSKRVILAWVASALCYLLLLFTSKGQTAVERTVIDGVYQ